MRYEFQQDTIQTFPIKSIVSHYRENNAYTVQVQRSIDTLQTFTFYTTQVIFPFYISLSAQLYPVI